MATKSKPTNAPTNTDQLFKQMRLSRVLIAAGIMLCSVPLYLASNSFWDSRLYTTGCVLLFMWSVMGILAAKVWLAPKKYTGKTAGVFSTVYWALLIGAFIPYMIADSKTMPLPFHTLLLCALLICLPIGGINNSILHFALFGAAAVLSATLGGSNLLYTLVCGFIAVSGFILALVLGRQQTGVVGRLNVDARTDFLTGILNRTGGMEKLKQVRTKASAENKLLAVVLVRVLDFESYISSYGRAAGDTALARVAAALKQRSKGKYDFVFRYDDDDFVLVQAVPGSEGYINGFAANCLQDIEDLRIAKSSLKDDYLSVAAGITFATPGDVLTDGDILIEQATEATRQAIDKEPKYHIFEH